MLLSSPAAAQDATEAAATPTPYPEIAPPNTGFKLTVSPPVLDMRTVPGVPTSTEIMVKSFSDSTEDITVSLMKFKPDETGAKPVLLDLEPTDEFPNWVTISESRFTLEPETWKHLTVTFAPPENALPAYYFAIVFNRQKEIEIQQGQVAKGAAAILVLTQISSSRVYHQLDLAQLDGNQLAFYTDRKIYEFLPVNFTTSIVNAGNVHELAYGNIFVDWVSGKKTDVAILDVNPERSFTLPQTTRTFENTWIDGFPHWEVVTDAGGNPVLKKNGQPERKLKWDFSKLTSFRIGKYSATLVLIYNDGTRDIPLEAQTDFWVIPWRILLALLIILLLILYSLKNIIHKAYDRLRGNRKYPR